MNRAFAKSQFYRFKSQIPNYSDHHSKQRLHSVLQGYKCYIYKYKFGLSAHETAERLGIQYTRVYELLRKYSRIERLT